MGNEAQSLVRRVAKTFRYLRMEQLIGASVVVSDIKNPIEPLISAVKVACPELKLTAPPESDIERLQAVFLKYGFLDVTLGEHTVAMESVSLGGIKMLEKLGFVSHDPAQYESANLDDESNDCTEDLLAALMEETLTSNLYLMIFLSKPETLRNSRRTKVEGPPCPDDFPITFTITDACLTNAPTSWFHRHFYL